MESPKPAGSPLRQSRVPSGFYESRHDIELQSPTTASFLVDEKFIGPFPSPPVTPQQHGSGVSLMGVGRKPPARKYSREWWQSSWDIAVANRVWPRVLYIAFGISIITIWVGLTVHFATDQVRWDRGDDQKFAQQIHSAQVTPTSSASTSTASSTPTPAPDRLPFFSLSGSLKSFDPVARNLHVEWSGLFQLELTDQPVPLANGTYPNAFWPMDIYRDISTVVFDATYYDNITTPENIPVDQRDYSFRIDNSTAKHIGTLGMHKWDSIPTDITFQQNAEQSDWTTQPLFSYPFDEWKGSIVFVGDFRWDETERSYYNASQGNYTGTNIVPFAGARLEDNSLNWRFGLNFTNECYSSNITNIKKYINESLGTGIDMDLVLSSDWYLREVPVPCNLDITIVGTRPPLVQFAAIMALLVNWISTIFIFVLTAECLLMRRGFMMSGTDLLGVTFTSLFALPSVRLLLGWNNDYSTLSPFSNFSMESSKAAESLEQSRVNSRLYEGRRDLEIQSPGTASFLVNEKNRGPSSSPPITPQQHNSDLSMKETGIETPTRKYSREWWHSTWDRAVVNRVWPRALYIAFGIGIITIWIGLTVHFATDQVRWDRRDDQPFVRVIRENNLDDPSKLGWFSLSGSLKSFDPVARSLNIEWSGLFQEHLEDKPVPLANGTYPNIFWPMDIYRDVSTVAFDATGYTDPTIHDNKPFDERQYLLKIDNSTAKHIGSIGWHEWDSVSTDITFQQKADESDWRSQPLFSYPFDEWKGRIVFVADLHGNANEKTYTNTSQGNYTGTNIVPFAGARLEDNSLNWRFSLTFTNECYTNSSIIKEQIIKSVNPGFNLEEIIQNDVSLASVPMPCNLDIEIIATRPPLVQFAAILAVFVNWISTMFIFVLTAESLVMRRGFMLSGTDLLGVTFTSLFALPSVRLLLPGKPT
ncbi:hypothetical protein M408DRAFT_27605 [Serendipita vermifera MAFF 305830]|uniref:Uncharacterized protein n=1 Tax=Serendipita vermifera MAFF 305830 TaxID=933852 RepID=A0A0C2WBI2_SERVB|nr:hypothetical protein M408DRAFT_27605 [Serendipita vermifera MAFF 305830]